MRCRDVRDYEWPEAKDIVGAMLHRAPTVLFALLLCPHSAQSQTLAHPGWRGNGIAPEAWWKHAVVVRMPADSTFTTAASTLDAMSQLGADSLLLPELQPLGERLPGAQPFAARFGTEDELDALLREAAARRMHVLLTADISRLAAHSNEVRYWMSHGIAGFDVGTLTAADMGSLSVLRTSLGRFPGQKVVMTDFSGWFPEKIIPPPLPGGAICLERGTNAIGKPETGLVTFAAYHARSGDVLGGVPVFDASVLNSAAQKMVVHTYLAQRHTKPEKGKSGVPAKPLHPAL